MGKISASLREGVTDLARGARAFPGSFRRAIRDPRSMTAGANPVPIVVLFSHTFLDAFDRGGFNIILPEVQDHFDLDLQAISSLAAVATVAGIALSLPVSLVSDRSGRRITFLALGAFLAAGFSLLAGVASTIGLFAVSRAGFGFGLIVNDPVQQSLLSDFTPVTARPSVFSGRQIADNLGNLLGPLAFGLLAFAFGFRAPLFLVAVMAVVVASMSLRLKEPRKGAQERAALGATGADLDLDDETLGFRDANRMLRSIATVRLLWRSIPFLFGGVLVILIATPLYLEEEFGFDAADRGMFGAVQGFFSIAGLFVGSALIKRYLFSDQPARMFRLMSGIGVAIAFGHRLPRHRAERRADVPRLHGADHGGGPDPAGLRHAVLDRVPGARPYGRLRHHPGLGAARADHGADRRRGRRRLRAAVGHRAQHPDPAHRVVDRRDRRERASRPTWRARTRRPWPPSAPRRSPRTELDVGGGSRMGVDPPLGDLEEPGAARVAQLEQEEPGGHPLEVGPLPDGHRIDTGALAQPPAPLEPGAGGIGHREELDRSSRAAAWRGRARARSACPRGRSA